MKGLGAWKKVIAGAKQEEEKKAEKKDPFAALRKSSESPAGDAPGAPASPLGLLGKLRQTVALAKEKE